jgi:hypothetical protein
VAPLVALLKAELTSATVVPAEQLQFCPDPVHAASARGAAQNRMTIKAPANRSILV